MKKADDIKPLVYFAAPLFSEAELAYNLKIAKLFEKFFDVFLPQRDGGKVVDHISNLTSSIVFRNIYNKDIQAIEKADIFFILLDGRAVDEGAAFELGYARALNKLCIGLQTDPRRLFPHGNNPMIQCSLDVLFNNKKDLSDWILDASRMHFNKGKK